MLTAVGEKLVLAVPVKYQKLAREFLKFGITGTVGAIVDFGSYNILSRGFGWDSVYHLFGYELIAANLVSVPLAICSNFILNKYWTFHNTEKKVLRQSTGYFVMNVFTFALNQLLVSFFAFRVPAVGNIFGNQKDNAAKVLAIGIILFVNFLGSKWLVFRKSGNG
ncbi:MAG: GtrA family protein [bacterium]|nr:GtrA family protein [bacterium]MDZ4345238.1 GtrA family protein [Candidatus Binatia bacterium]